MLYLQPVDLNIGILFIVALGSLATIGIFMAGYGSNNKFALIGGMRIQVGSDVYDGSVRAGLEELGRRF